MKKLGDALDHPWTFWVLLCLPALPMIAALAGLGGYEPRGAGQAARFASETARLMHVLVHPTGEWAARFLIVSLACTPLVMLRPQARFPRWLLARRRYLGVAAFAYAAAHTVFYLIDRGAVAVEAQELARTLIWSGWLAFLIFVPLAATSFDGAVHAMGPGWKWVQRWVYAAALLTFLHWLVIRHGPVPALVHFAPLAALEGYRIWWNWLRPKPDQAARAPAA
jgi:sulfoxide reductase heme-binding subunit YedZ